jgi:hypothetical protein
MEISINFLGVGIAVVANFFWGALVCSFIWKSLGG